MEKLGVAQKLALICDDKLNIGFYPPELIRIY